MQTKSHFVTVLLYYATILIQEPDPAMKFAFDGCVIISLGLTTNQEHDSTCNN